MKPKKRTIIITAVCILAVALGISGFLIYEQVRPSRQSDFPPPRESDLIGFSVRSDVRDQVETADLIIQGTVIKVFDPEEEEIPATVPDEYIDVMGGGPSKVTFHRFEISVEETVKGELDTETVQLIVTHQNIRAIPPLTEGTKMVFCLDEWPERGGYGILSVHDGFYYIARDNKVYPVDPSGYMERISGMELSALKEEMRGYARQQAE